MKSLLFLVSIITVVAVAQGQTRSSNMQKNFDGYIQLANEAVDKTGEVLYYFINSYERVGLYKDRNSYSLTPFHCPLNNDGNIYTFPSGIAALDKPTKQLIKSLDKLDATCKQLDIYFKLQDYKADKFKTYDSITQVMLLLDKDIHTQIETLQSETYTIYKTTQPTQANAYNKANSLMYQSLQEEKKVLDSYNYNLNTIITTGWPVATIAATTAKTEENIKKLRSIKVGLGQYGKTTLEAYVQSLESILNLKRQSIDNYNASAQQSDKYGNEQYILLYKVYNGELLGAFNNFVNLAAQDGFYGLKQADYLPIYTIRNKSVQEQFAWKTYQDIPYTSFNLASQPTQISPALYETLKIFITFINEAHPEVDAMIKKVQEFGSSVAYEKKRKVHKPFNKLPFGPGDYKLPKSSFQQIKEKSTNIPVVARKSLVDQAQVLMNILKEIEELAIAIDKETESLRYQKDTCSVVFNMMTRYNALFEDYDSKKEQLYKDVRRIFEAFKDKDPKSSWTVSGKALLTQIDLNREALFQAKAYYLGDTGSHPNTEKLTKQARKLITEEFTNMKGLVKYGRSHGLCPYTPYEDIPENARYYAEDLLKIKTRPVTTNYFYYHPYYTYVNMYNISAEYYNKFCELAKQPLLPMVYQPNRFSLDTVTKKQEVIVKVTKAKESTFDQKTPQVNSEMLNVDTKENAPLTTKLNDKNTSDVVDKVTKEIIHDTIFIETNKIDTLLLREAQSGNYTLEGYANSNLVLLLDVSGSMTDSLKLPLLKKSMEKLLKVMRKEDKVSIVIYAGDASVALKATPATESKKIIKILESLNSSGYTNAIAGIKLAYQMADKSYIRAGNNRIILATDGEFKINKGIEELISKYAEQDVQFSIFNFGSKVQAFSPLLKKLAQLGKGNYEHITPTNSDFNLLREIKAKKTLK